MLIGGYAGFGFGFTVLIGVYMGLGFWVYSADRGLCGFRVLGL